MKKTIMHFIGGLGFGGAEKFLSNLLINIDKSKYKFIVVCYENNSNDYEDIIKKNGAVVEYISAPANGYINYIKSLNKIIKAYNPDVIHCHTLFNSCFPVLIAKKLNIKKIIVHSHSTQSNAIKETIFRKMYYNFSRLIINFFSTDKVACGKDAGLFLFNSLKNVKIIHNGIVVRDYLYNTKERKKIRKAFDADSKTFLFVHVGRFCIAKNHKFLINLFYEFNKEYANSKLILIGKGELEEEIRKLVKHLRLDDKVFFVGNVNNVNSYYCGSDCMIFPSLYEGIPLVLVEAQTNGIPIIASDRIDNSVNYSNAIRFLSVDNNIKDWISLLRKINITDCRQSIIDDNPYDILETCKEVEKLY